MQNRKIAAVWSRWYVAISVRLLLIIFISLMHDSILAKHQIAK